MNKLLSTIKISISNIVCRILHTLQLPNIQCTKYNIQRGFIRLTKKSLVMMLMGVLIFTGSGLYLLMKPKPASAAWFNDNWAYRASIPITAHTSAENNVYITVTLDTATLITNSKLQSDCGDLRFTKENGELLPYFINASPGCNNAATTIQVNFDSFPAGAQTIYYYYGNPQAPNGFVSSAFSTAATGDTEGSVGSEEKAKTPVAYWKFDDGTGTTTKDSTPNNNTGTLAGSTKPTWQPEDVCVSGKCLYFQGTISNVTVANTVSNVQTVSFWVYPMASNSASLITLNSTTDITAASGVVSATGSASPTIYVNGIANALLTQNVWQMVTVTTDTPISASTIKFGQAPTGILKGFMDEVKIYNYTRTAAQIKSDYSARKNPKGVSAVLGSASSNPDANLSKDLTGYWKFDNGTGTSVTDYSGYNQTLTIRYRSAVNPSSWATGKFGQAFQDAGYAYPNDEAAQGTWRAPVQTDFSVSLWVSPSATPPPTTGGFIVSRWWGDCDVTYQPGWQLSYSTSTRKLTFKIAADSCGPDKTLNSNAALTTGQWTHIVIVHKTGDSMKIYINGALDNSVTYTGGLNPTPPQISFGCGANNSSCEYPGLTDEARVYNRALSVAEVVQLYNYVPPANTVAQWSFEDGAGSSLTDTSGNTNTGTWNGTGANRWVRGKYGKAGNLNGSNDYISGGNGSSLQLIKDLSLSAWVKLNSTSSNQDIIAKRGNAGQWGYRLWVNDTGTPQFDISVDGTSMATVSANTALTADTWYHLVGAYSRDTSLKLYINGNLDNTNTTSIPGAIKNSTANVNIGGENSGATNLFNGALDEAKIYNIALTQKQVVQDMNAGHPAVGSPIGSAIGHWKFDDGYGTTANNSGNMQAALNGTLSGSSLPTWRTDGKILKALNFNGTSAYVTAGNSSALQLTSDLTLSAWVNLATNNAVHDIAAKNGAEGQYGYRLFTDANGKLSIEISQNGTAIYVATSSSALTNQTWYHVAGVYSSAAPPSLTVYVNGAQAGTNTTSIPNSLKNSSANFEIGSENGGGTNLMTGSIDEVKIYNYTLTASEIEVEYNRASALVLGSMSDTSGLTGGSVASNSASAEYCVPGDSSSCAAPVGRWDFEKKTGQTVYDTSGNGFNATLGANSSSGSDDPTWTNGKIGGALKFDGTNDYAFITDNALLKPATFTISFWVKKNSEPDNWDRIMEKLDGTTAGWSILFDNLATKKAYLATKNTAGSEYNTNSVNTALPVGIWKHYAYVFDGSKIYSYENGIPLTSMTFSGTYNPASTNLAFGSTAGPGSFGPITLDQVRIFNYARSAAQIAWDYNRGAPVGHWKFDECQGTTANDSSGNSNTGTITIGSLGSQSSLGTCAAGAATAWKDGATGKRNYSLDFDGTDDYVDVNPSSNTYINLTGNHTVRTYAIAN